MSKRLQSYLVFALALLLAFTAILPSITPANAVTDTAPVFSAKAYYVGKGYSVKLTVDNTDGQKVVWGVSKAAKKKIRVTSTTANTITVRGKKTGSANVYANVNGKQCRATVKVRRKYVKLSAGSKTMTLGDTASISITGVKSAKWYTSNRKIASIKKTGRTSARITAVGLGTTYVRAKVGRKNYRCKVTVVAKPKPSGSTDVKPGGSGSSTSASGSTTAPASGTTSGGSAPTTGSSTTPSGQPQSGSSTTPKTEILTPSVPGVSTTTAKNGPFMTTVSRPVTDDEIINKVKITATYAWEPCKKVEQTRYDSIYKDSTDMRRIGVSKTNATTGVTPYVDTVILKVQNDSPKVLVFEPKSFCCTTASNYDGLYLTPCFVSEIGSITVPAHASKEVKYRWNGRIPGSIGACSIQLNSRFVAEDLNGLKQVRPDGANLTQNNYGFMFNGFVNFTAGSKQYSFLYDFLGEGIYDYTKSKFMASVIGHLGPQGFILDLSKEDKSFKDRLDKIAKTSGNYCVNPDFKPE